VKERRERSGKKTKQARNLYLLDFLVYHIPSKTREKTPGNRK
jgi:hypothetical protein